MAQDGEAVRSSRADRDTWAAPCAQAPVDATVEVPGSKSGTNRALVLAALAPGGSRLQRPLRSRDTELMAAALRALGVAVQDDGADWLVDGVAGPLTGGAAVDLGNAGTVARFLPPVAALATGPVHFDGDPRMRERPVGPLLAALRRLGARIDDGGRGGFPLTVTGGGGLRGGPVTLDASTSSQLVSGLLLAASRLDEGVTVRHEGPPVPSAPHLAMTVAMLRAAGAEVDDATPDRWSVRPGPLSPGTVAVEPDLSSAAPFLAAAAVTAGRVRLPGWPATTTQPGDRLPELLVRMGCSVGRGPAAAGGGLELTGPDRLVGLTADLHEIGELTPVITAVCALAAGPSRLTGVAHLRRHETDRLAALAAELNRLGGDVRELPDGLEIRPRRLAGGPFRTYDDHRLAMAGAVLGLAVPGISVQDPGTTAKTFPGFVPAWSRMLGLWQLAGAPA